MKSDSVDDREQLQPVDARKFWRRVLLIAMAIAVLLVAVGLLAAGKSGAEKTLTRLVQPIGFGWLLLSAWCLQRTLADGLQKAFLPWLVWLAVMFLTTAPFAEWCLSKIESSVESYLPERDGQLAAVVVLGGGTREGPWRAELGSAGDRVMYAAQLFLQNHTQRLITTGDATPGISRNLSSPREQTQEIWSQLKIPADAIGALQGQNTYQEIQSLKKIFDQFQGGRIGILTSALHLPRALRLAKAQGLDVVPLAADHLSSAQPLTFLDFIPSAGPLNQLAACQHEFMAKFVSR
jgi:uncharacterized SAM-binding protein YcdF (DUF218 family)